MNRKQYITSLIIYFVISVSALITNAIFEYASMFVVITVIFLGYLFIKYRVDGSLQYFSSRFNMLLDYDLEVQAALDLAVKAYENAPTTNMKTSYQLYVGMAHYYCGNYDESIKTFQLLDLNRMNPVFHALVFSFTAYSAFELKDQETFDGALSRLTNLVNQVPSKYQSFVSNYIEVLEAIKNKDIAIDRYKEMVEKHFSLDDGYIARKLNYQYRLSYYYQAIGDTLEMDKCLAFCIANGKEQHIAKRAKELFKGSVEVSDYVYDPLKPNTEKVEVNQLEEVEIKDDQEVNQ